MARGQLNFSGSANQRDDTLSNLGSVIGNYANKLANQERLAAQDQRKLEQANALERQRIATNEGISASLNPSRFGQNQVNIEQAGIAQSLANLSPQDRAIAEQQVAANYNPTQRAVDVAQQAVNNPNADQGGILRALSQQANINRANLQTAQATPGTPEFKAAEDARLAENNRKISQQKALFDYKQASKAAVDAKDAQGLAYVLRQQGIKVRPNATYAEVKALSDNYNKTQDAQLKQQSKIALEELKNTNKDKNDAKLRLGGATNKTINQFKNSISIPLIDRGLSGRDDTTFFNKFFDNKGIQDALRSNKLTSKQVEGRITELLKSNDNDLEDALEALSEVLGKPIDL